MLKNRIEVLLKKEIELDDLTEEVSKIIKKAIDSNDSTILDHFFGPSAYKNYLNNAEMIQLNEDKSLPKDEKAYQYFNTMFLRLGFYYACRQGNLKITQYFIENQHLPGDLDANISEFQTFLQPQTQMKGPPLNLAVESGNLDVVKFIYEKTNATVETGIGQPIDPTALMKACEDDNEEMVEYLLEKGGNPNAEMFASWNSTTPLTIAIRAKNPSIVQLLVTNGAIVSNAEVNLALSKKLDLTIIQLLLQHSVNRENPYHPYVLSAIKSGNVSLLKAIEKNPLVKSVEEIASFSQIPIEKRMLLAAAESGEIKMMKYLVEERKLPLIKYLLEEYAYFESIIEDEYESLSAIQNSTHTILYYAACNNDRKNVIPLLQYLFEQEKPSDNVIKKLCSNSLYEIHTVAYLHSLVSTHCEEKAKLESIAFNLEDLSLTELFAIYNTKFVYKGNFYEKLGCRDYLKEIEQCISVKTCTLTFQDIFNLIKNDKEVATGALFYYATKQFDRNFEMLSFLLTQLTICNPLFPNVDIKNCNGDTLAKFAVSQHSYHIVKHLLMRGADPDTPNYVGETLLNPLIDFSYLREREFSWIKDYVADDDFGSAVKNSLSYETKRYFGGNEGIEALLKLTNGMIGNLSLAQLIKDCKHGHNSNWKNKSLLKNLSEKYVCEMVRLVKHQGLTLARHELEYYFSRIKNFNLDSLYKSNEETHYKASSSVLFKAKEEIPAKSEDGISQINTLRQ